MKMPYLGRISLRWCPSCNVPVLANRCGRCDAETSRVPITPPGDVRPATQKDIEEINHAVKEQFGSALIPEGRIVLLNRAPDHDRLDEIIMDGTVVGALRFDIEDRKLVFMPRVEGAFRVWKEGGKGFVAVATDAADYILKGRSVLIPGVTDYDRRLKKDQEVIVICDGSVIAVGKTRMSGEEAAKASKGMFVKVRRYLKDEVCSVPEGGQDWNRVLECNRDMLIKLEEEALTFIGKTFEKYMLPAVVSFSGGKDSLATLLLVRKKIDPRVLFVDTGIEFPDTLAYVDEIQKAFGFELIRADAGDRFWRGVEIFGMSGKDYRWCCKVCKLGPVAKVIDERFPEGVLNFIGQRRYESETRARSGSVWRNSWLPKQVSASPVQNWNALHIWLYIMRENAPVNPLYDRGLERIGCWPCPSSSLYELEVLKDVYPDLWKLLCDALIKSGMPQNYVRYGFWRWRVLPPAHEKLHTRLFGDNISFVRRGGVTEVDMDRASHLSMRLGFEGEDVLMRGSLCLGCGMCLAHCEQGAIEFHEGKIWINENCSGCGVCHGKCPVVKYKL